MLDRKGVIGPMQLLTMKELMAFLKVKRNTVYQLRRKGLPVIHLGRSVRFDREEIIKWIRVNCSIETAKTPNVQAKDEAAVAVAGAADFLL